MPIPTTESILVGAGLLLLTFLARAGLKLAGVYPVAQWSWWLVTAPIWGLWALTAWLFGIALLWVGFMNLVRRN